jgi:hypothetical protein
MLANLMTELQKRGFTMVNIEEMREQLGYAFGGSAHWRGEVATRYPDDDRNAAASTELQTLEASVVKIPDKLMQAYCDACEFYDSRDQLERFLAIENEMRNGIGFRGSWESAADFVRDLLDESARQLR